MERIIIHLKRGLQCLCIPYIETMSMRTEHRKNHSRPRVANPRGRQLLMARVLQNTTLRKQYSAILHTKTSNKLRKYKSEIMGGSSWSAKGNCSKNYDKIVEHMRHRHFHGHMTKIFALSFGYTCTIPHLRKKITWDNSKHV